MFGSFAYIVMYIYSNTAASFQLFTLAHDRSQNYKSDQLKLLKSLAFHSILKQALTDGASYLMVFTRLLPLKVQGKN